KKYFSQAAAGDDSSPLPENNLAVIAAGEKLDAVAFMHYGKALKVSGDNRLLLDNIAAALGSYVGKGGDKQAAAYKNLVREVEGPEGRMELAMATKKLR